MDEETIVAVYDTPAAADAAVADLRAAKVPESAISRHSGSTGMAGATQTTAEPVQERGFWSSLFGGDTGYEHDATVYDRSMQGGSSVVTVKSTPGHDVEAVAAILERHSPIDIDERAAGYGLTAGNAARPPARPPARPLARPLAPTGRQEPAMRRIRPCGPELLSPAQLEHGPPRLALP